MIAVLALVGFCSWPCDVPRAPLRMPAVKVVCYGTANPRKRWQS